MRSAHYYITKIIAIISILFSGYLIYTFTYYAYEIWQFTRSFDVSLIAEVEESLQSNSLMGIAGLVVIAGIIGLIGSLGLFLFKKWGFYMMGFFVLSLWATSWMIVDGISQNWFHLLIFSLIFIYLIWQRKFILNYRKNLSEDNL